MIDLKETKMAKFDLEQAIAWVAIQQLVNDWGYELDVNNGLNIADLVTDACSYTVRGVARTSRMEVAAFYKTRIGEFPDGPPVQRHAQTNLRVQFKTADEASITFTLIYFTMAMVAAGADPADPTAVADVVMDVRRCDDGHWRISMFDSAQSLVRIAK
jgi:SnoaL-like domain